MAIKSIGHSLKLALNGSDAGRPIVISATACLLALLGVSLGSFMHGMLSEVHLTSESKEVIRLSIGIVATLAALVLGLLIASAKSTYDARRSDINRLTADVILLDYLLLKYGDDAKAARVALRQAIPPVVQRIWRERQSLPVHAEPLKPLPEGEAFYQSIQDLRPINDTQHGLQMRIMQVTSDLMQSRLLLFSDLRRSIPRPFLAVLLLWMVVLFSGFSIMAAANIATVVFLVICALSVSGAIFLILELDQPFAGIMMIPNEPLLNALRSLND